MAEGLVNDWSRLKLEIAHALASEDLKDLRFLLRSSNHISESRDEEIEDGLDFMKELERLEFANPADLCSMFKVIQRRDLWSKIVDFIKDNGNNTTSEGFNAAVTPELTEIVREQARTSFTRSSITVSSTPHDKEALGLGELSSNPPSIYAQEPTSLPSDLQMKRVESLQSKESSKHRDGVSTPPYLGNVDRPDPQEPAAHHYQTPSLAQLNGQGHEPTAPQPTASDYQTPSMAELNNRDRGDRPMRQGAASGELLTDAVPATEAYTAPSQSTAHDVKPHLEVAPPPARPPPPSLPSSSYYAPPRQLATNQIKLSGVHQPPVSEAGDFITNFSQLSHGDDIPAEGAHGDSDVASSFEEVTHEECVPNRSLVKRGIDPRETIPTLTKSIMENVLDCITTMSNEPADNSKGKKGKNSKPAKKMPGSKSGPIARSQSAGQMPPPVVYPTATATINHPPPPEIGFKYPSRPPQPGLVRYPPQPGIVRYPARPPQPGIVRYPAQTSPTVYPSTTLPAYTTPTTQGAHSTRGYPAASATPTTRGYPAASATPTTRGYPAASAAPTTRGYPAAPATPTTQGYAASYPHPSHPPNTQYPNPYAHTVYPHAK